MNQEIKERLEQAMRKQFTLKASKDKVRRIAYFSGAQTILENPSEWGLIEEKSLYSTLKSTVLESENKDIRVNLMSAKIKGLQSQLTKYREALERIVNTSSVDAIAFPLQIVSEFYNIAKEALKQEDTK